jgi:thiamine monophosphate synthase
MEIGQPWLVVIAERSVFRNSGEWKQYVLELAEYLPAHPRLHLQVRSKDSETDRTWASRTLAASPRVRLNAGLPEAVRLGHSHVHHPEAECPTASQKHSFGVSVHCLESALIAERSGAEYVQFGPVFDPISKAGQGQGLIALGSLTRTISIPVIAVGGMNPKRAVDCIRAGAAGIACIGHVLRADNSRTAIGELLDAMVR